VKEHHAFRFRLFAHGLQWDCTRCLHFWHIWRLGVGAFFTTDCSLLFFLFCLQESIIGNMWDSRIPHYEDITTLR
jgi:hypothetical protein